MKRYPSLEKGFTIIEMIVSLGVFSIVITISVGALLVLVASNQQLQAERSVMTNLSFALDSMTREIRTGSNYFCDSRPNLSSNHPGGIGNMFNPNTDMDEEIGDSVLDCPTGNSTGQQYHGLSFKESGNSITASDDRILYYFSENDGKIYRRIGAGSSESVVGSGVYIRDMHFNVTGAQSLDDGDARDQASVTIYIEASEKSPAEDPAGKTYYLQTTVTQRTIDL